MRKYWPAAQEGAETLYVQGQGEQDVNGEGAGDPFEGASGAGGSGGRRVGGGAFSRGAPTHAPLPTDETGQFWARV